MNESMGEAQVAPRSTTRIPNLFSIICSAHGNLLKFYRVSSSSIHGKLFARINMTMSIGSLKILRLFVSFSFKIEALFSILEFYRFFFSVFTSFFMARSMNLFTQELFRIQLSCKRLFDTQSKKSFLKTSFLRLDTSVM